jgi:glycosyltransferase involved in cell wall biosynthesis
MNSLLSAIKDFNVCIAKHTWTPKGGVEEELLDFLKDKVKTIVYISHPFKEAHLPSLRSEALVYRDGALVERIKAPLIKGPAVLFYVKDIIATVWFIARLRLRFDLFVGVDNLNALSGYILKKIGRVKKLIFYVIDYSPKRFENSLMNVVYHRVDFLACYKADSIWNLSDAMMDMRKARGINIKKCAPSITVPHGNRFNSIMRRNIQEIARHRIAYFGQLREEHGADTIIDLFGMVKKEIADASLLVIGTGDRERFMRERAKELGVRDAINFTGFIDDHRECEELLATSAIGLAPYPESSSSYKYFSDPGKIKAYLACGLPIVMTRVPPIATQVEAKKAGFIVNDNIEQMKDAILALLKDDALYTVYRECAIRMGAAYDWGAVFSSALTETLSS